MNSVSVIIPTYNRGEMLATVLPSYLQFSVVEEVLVVDDGCTDKTAEIVRYFAQTDERVKLLQHEGNRGMTFARNTGIQYSLGNLVLSSEDDLALAPGSLDILVEHMQQSQADIIAGRRIWMRIGEDERQALCRANRSHQRVVATRLMEHFSHANPPSDVISPLVSSTMLVRRSVLDVVRFPSCYPSNAWREDSDFQLMAQTNGFRVVFCPHALCFHHDRAIAGRGGGRLRSDARYLYWMCRNNITFLRRHRHFLRRNYPESLVLNSPELTTMLYMGYRATVLAQTELRRAWRSYKQRQRP